MKVTRKLKGRVLEACPTLNYNYQLDPYRGCEHLCHYCYALNKAETDWEKEILIHENLPAQLNAELDLLEPQVIYIGMNSDPYQHSELKYRQTRKALELIAEKKFSASVLTKSNLIIRDIDLFCKMPSPSAGISIAFTDEVSRKRFEKKAYPTAERIEALKTLKEAGISTYALVCPVLPYITDVETLISRVTPYADQIWTYRLKIDSPEDPNWINLNLILKRYYPALRDAYREIIFSESHDYWHEIKEVLDKAGLNCPSEIIDCL